MKRMKKLRAASTALMFAFGAVSLVALMAAAASMSISALLVSGIAGVSTWFFGGLADEADRRIQVLRDMRSGFFREG